MYFIDYYSYFIDYLYTFAYQIEINMKKIVTLIAIFSSINLFSQAITVNTTTWSVPQLVNDVLINSECINATNINWRTGTNFGSSNGIGYFQNTNPNFPMQSGVILTTGNAMNAPGPNTTMLNDGTTTWTGDSSLESILLASGISMNSVNATVLEFDFTPISSHFDFDFLFASEEYGNFQCQFSDAFAFLLTNLNTGVTTNLAVVPGTNSPISVVTIRNFLYNSTCNSQNPQYFGSFNGGSNAAGAAINYNGQTVVMNASSVLTPNVPYRIKLVIADRQDSQSDSAIFLSSNSFNIGQEVLGLDLSVANNAALCNGSSQTLNSGLDPNAYTFQWKKDGVLLVGETGPSLIISQPGSYEILYTNTTLSCLNVSDTIIVEFYPDFVTPAPNNLYKCDTGAANYVFDLTQNTPVLTTGLPSGTTVAYFANATDAQNNTNALPNNYTSVGNQTVYVRINNPDTGCYTVKQFDLLVITPPVGQSTVVNRCSSFSQPGLQWFDLSSITGTVLNGLSPSIYTVNYYLNLTDAQNGTNLYPNPNYFTATTTIYASVTLLSDSNCSSIVPIDLVVNPMPLVDELEDIITCISYTLPPLTNGNYFSGSGGTGTPMFAGDVITVTQTIFIYNTTNTTPACTNESSFTVTIIKPEELDMSTKEVCDAYFLPSLPFGQYFTQAAGQGTELAAGTQISSNQTIYFYFQSITPPFCVIDLNFDVIVTPSPNISSLPNAFDCVSYALPTIPFGTFYDGPNGTGNELTPGTAITSSKTIYIYATNGQCHLQNSFEVIIGLDFQASVTECASFTLPQLPIGNYFTAPAGSGTLLTAGTVITSTQNIYIYVPTTNNPNCTDNYFFTVTITLPVIVTPSNLSNCGEYILPVIPVGNYFTGSLGSGTALQAGDIINSSQTLYIFVDNGNGCQNEAPISITVYPLPVIDSRPDQTPCNAYTLTNLSNGNYFTGPNGTGTMLNGGDLISISQTIYIYATNNNGCVAETSFNIDIFMLTSDIVNDATTCDSYILPSLSANNHYYTQTGGPHGTGTEILPGTAITTTQTIYVYIESAERINCFDEKSFVVTIIPTPYVGNFTDVKVCDSYTLPVLAVGNYFTEPGGNGTQLNTGDVLTTDQTIYVFAQSGTAPNCSDEKSFTVTIFNVDEISDVTICESYTLPSLTIGNYYNGPNGTGGMISQGSNVTTSKTIYVFAYSGYNPNCSDETSFNVTIIDTPVVNFIPVSLRTFCDEDGVNDGITNVDLTTLSASALGSQTGAEFNVAYYENLNDATNNTNSITNTLLTTVYVRVNNSLAPSCYDIKPFSFLIHKIPEPILEDGIVCIDSQTGTLLNSYSIYSGLSSSTHTFEWFDGNGQTIGTGSSYVATQPGTYSLLATNTITGCTSEETFVTVNQSQPAIVAYSVSEDFTQNQTVTVTATGTGGNYEYQMDNGVFQDSPIFENVESGIHTIVVRDKNGCGITVIEALVVNYPHYFTPNGDGTHDTWNIVDLKEQHDSVINIFDRYGKLMKQIYPSGQGWDGTYNGNQAISDDYWFTISYTKNNEQREFKAHFALKR
jgi:gliding motility-associated-like protein